MVCQKMTNVMEKKKNEIREKGIRSSGVVLGGRLSLKYNG